jgi:hypothetical protein
MALGHHSIQGEPPTKPVIWPLEHPKERQDDGDHNNQANDIDDIVHSTLHSAHGHGE